MDHKRKANTAAAPGPDDRSSKRRKLSDFDLSKGESRESTTAYGLSFLEQIRRTADKRRPVATCFEKLPPREGNADYYKRTRLPISLETIEVKLHKGYFQSLAELESYFKRMISNAKEYHARASPVFDNAERVRKALSNYMTKTNPAYGIPKYQAQPTPLPPEGADLSEAEGDGGAGHQDGAQKPNESKRESTKRRVKEREKEEQSPEPNGSDGGGPNTRRRSIVLKRRESGRASRPSQSQTIEPAPETQPPPSPQEEHQYQEISYKGLTFQSAQEKIIEDLLRYNEPEYEAYFEPFHNLPSRSLKDYYRVITEPMSLKKLRKAVQGVHGRNDPTGISDFKTWAAFEQKARLLWANAYYYNEEESDIYELAQELEKAFYRELKKAQEDVPEPAQPKIKLKVGQDAETPTTSKKITIHIGGRGPSADPATAQTTETPTAAVNGTKTRTPARLEPASSVSVSAPTPLPAAAAETPPTAQEPLPSPPDREHLKTEDGTARLSPVVAEQTPPAGTPAPARPPAAVPAQPPAPPVKPTPPPQAFFEPKRFGRLGKGVQDALISRLRLQLHPCIQAERNNLLIIHPHQKELRQFATISLPLQFNRVYLITMLPPFLQERQYSLWILSDKQPVRLHPQPLPNQLPDERAFEVVLHPGLNVLEAHLIAAIPRAEREEGGPEVELEIFTVFAHVLRG